MRPRRRNYILGAVCVFIGGAHPVFAGKASQDFIMCSPGSEIFGETFEDGSLSDRWGIKAYFLVENGVLKRSDHHPEESARVFLKNTLTACLIIMVLA